MNEWFWMIPLISAIGGWVIALAARTVSQNRLPSLSGKFAEKAASELFTTDGIRSAIADSGNYQNIRPFIEEHIDQFLRLRLVKAMPMIGMFIGDKTILQLKAVFMKELEELFPVIVDKYLQTLNTTDSGTIIVQKIATIPSSHWKALFRGAVEKELRLIPLAGLLSGLIIGLIQLSFLLAII